MGMVACKGCLNGTILVFCLPSWSPNWGTTHSINDYLAKIPNFLLFIVANTVFLLKCQTQVDTSSSELLYILSDTF